MGPINIPTMEKRAVVIHASKDGFKREAGRTKSPCIMTLLKR